jgi:hypothetical protein
MPPRKPATLQNGGSLLAIITATLNFRAGAQDHSLPV